MRMGGRLGLHLPQGFNALSPEVFAHLDAFIQLLFRDESGQIALLPTFGRCVVPGQRLCRYDCVEHCREQEVLAESCTAFKPAVAGSVTPQQCMQGFRKGRILGLRPRRHDQRLPVFTALGLPCDIVTWQLCIDVQGVDDNWKTKKDTSESSSHIEAISCPPVCL